MRIHTLCTDYDGTIATDGVVLEPTLAALQRLRESGRRLVLVTGRELPDLQRVMPRLDLFDRVVAENGALLYTPSTGVERLLAEPPPPRLVQLLQQRDVRPLSVGRCIIATWEPADAAVLHAIRDLGLELQVIFNKGAVMVLPSGVNKATGLAAALDELGLSPRDAIGVGDAENDHTFLSWCEYSAAVANALPMLKQAADLVTTADHGAGVAELIDRILGDELAADVSTLARHRVVIALDGEGSPLSIDPHEGALLVAGTSGGGKSTAAIGILERLAARGYGYLVVDPEGDYGTLAGAVALGTPERAPSLEEFSHLLELGTNAVINLLGLPLADRPGYFAQLLSRLVVHRAHTGRPHWLFVDEAHHVLPADLQSNAEALPEHLGGVALLTVLPESIAPRALAWVRTLVAVGKSAEETVQRFGEAVGRSPQAPDAGAPAGVGEVLLWQPAEGGPPVRAQALVPQTELRRHRRKYAQGELPQDRSFYFRGPDEKLNLRVRNLVDFVQMADGVDDDTWEHHRRRGDYSRWIAEGIKDDDLAARVRSVEAEDAPTPADSRARVRAEIEQSYTLPQ